MAQLTAFEQTFVEALRTEMREPGEQERAEGLSAQEAAVLRVLRRMGPDQAWAAHVAEHEISSFLVSPTTSSLLRIAGMLVDGTSERGPVTLGSLNERIEATSRQLAEATERAASDDRS